jgi:hypothetical protein
MAMSAEQRRALELLAGSPHGCIESIMMAHGCAIGMLRDLVREGLATATRETVVAGGVKSSCGQTVGTLSRKRALQTARSRRRSRCAYRRVCRL